MEKKAQDNENDYGYFMSAGVHNISLCFFFNLLAESFMCV